MTLQERLKEIATTLMYEPWYRGVGDGNGVIIFYVKDMKSATQSKLLMSIIENLPGQTLRFVALGDIRLAESSKPPIFHEDA